MKRTQYVRIVIEVHGLGATDAAISRLTEYLHATTVEYMKSSDADQLQFRDEFTSDVDVYVEESAGQ